MEKKSLLSLLTSLSSSTVVVEVAGVIVILKILPPELVVSVHNKGDVLIEGGDDGAIAGVSEG